MVPAKKPESMFHDVKAFPVQAIIAIMRVQREDFPASSAVTVDSLKSKKTMVNHGDCVCLLTLHRGPGATGNC